ncbi:MAG: hypothetical protein EVA89_29345 [Sandaracinaceae bacterium]|nr:MAG: hypothetical protein EVA89_29345 [Sandaracinaceae bacterium]
MITPPASWSRIVADHENLWTEIADRLSPIAPNAWDLLICELDDVYGTTVIAPAKQNAPFWLPESPGDDERQHFEVLHEASVCRGLIAYANPHPSGRLAASTRSYPLEMLTA